MNHLQQSKMKLNVKINVRFFIQFLFILFLFFCQKYKVFLQMAKRATGSRHQTIVFHKSPLSSFLGPMKKKYENEM